ncbi:MAG: hypothetical protein ACKVTZ_09410, partial [Bacteroidia bacterium]
NVMLTKTCSGCFSCRKSAKTKFLQVIGQLKQPVQHYIYATTLILYHFARFLIMGKIYNV